MAASGSSTSSRGGRELTTGRAKTFTNGPARRPGSGDGSPALGPPAPLGGGGGHAGLARGAFGGGHRSHDEAALGDRAFHLLLALGLSRGADLLLREPWLGHGLSPGRGRRDQRAYEPSWLSGLRPRRAARAAERSYDLSRVRPCAALASEPVEPCSRTPPVAEWEELAVVRAAVAMPAASCALCVEMPLGKREEQGPLSATASVSDARVGLARAARASFIGDARGVVVRRRGRSNVGCALTTRSTIVTAGQHESAVGPDSHAGATTRPSRSEARQCDTRHDHGSPRSPIGSRACGPRVAAQRRSR